MHILLINLINSLSRSINYTILSTMSAWIASFPVIINPLTRNVTLHHRFRGTLKISAHSIKVRTHRTHASLNSESSRHCSSKRRATKSSPLSVFGIIYAAPVEMNPRNKFTRCLRQIARTPFPRWNSNFDVGACAPHNFHQPSAGICFERITGVRRRGWARIQRGRGSAKGVLLLCRGRIRG